MFRRTAEQKATSHSQPVTGAYLQLAGSLVVAVDLQKVVDVYLHLRHLLLLKSRRQSLLASVSRTPLLSVKVNFIEVLKSDPGLCPSDDASFVLCPIKSKHHAEMSPLHHPSRGSDRGESKAVGASGWMVLDSCVSCTQTHNPNFKRSCVFLWFISFHHKAHARCEDQAFFLFGSLTLHLPKPPFGD